MELASVCVHKLYHLPRTFSGSSPIWLQLKRSVKTSSRSLNSHDVYGAQNEQVLKASKLNHLRTRVTYFANNWTFSQLEHCCHYENSLLQCEVRCHSHSHLSAGLAITQNRSRLEALVKKVVVLFLWKNGILLQHSTES